MIWLIRAAGFCAIPVFLAQNVEYFAHSGGNERTKALVNNWQGILIYSHELKLKIMSNSKVLVGFLVGAAVGGALGLLLAPDKGSETRKKIIETGNDLGDSIAEFGGTVKDKFNEVVDGVKGSFNKTKNTAS